MKKVFLLILLSFSVVSVFSQIDSFLSWGVSAKSIGMGRTHTSLATDGSAIFYNPSLLSKIDTFEFLGNYSLFYEDSMYGFFSFVSPTPYGMVGLGLQNLSTTNIQIRDSSGKPLGTTDSRLTSLYLSFGSNLNKLFLSSNFVTLYAGASAKVISQKLYNMETGGVSFDIGLQTDLDFGFYKLLYGINFGNIVATSLEFYTKDEIPFIFRVSGGLLLFDESLKFGVDILQSKQVKNICFGLEYTVWKLFSIRTGINEQDISVGLGITRQNIQFNYAFVVNRPWKNIDMGILHTFDFKIKWSVRKK